MPEVYCMWEKKQDSEGMLKYLKKTFLVEEKNEKEVNQDLKSCFENADFTLECLMHILSDVKSEHPIALDMDKVQSDQLKAAIRAAIKVRMAGLEERQDEALDLVDEVLDMCSGRGDTNQHQGSIKESRSRQHDLWIKCQRARYLLGETDEMPVKWSYLEFFRKSDIEALDPGSKAKEFWFDVPFKAYYNSVRLRCSYMCWVTIAMSFAVFAGILTETFMSTFTPLVEKEKSTSFHAYLFLLPFLTIMFAFFCEGVIVLAFDSLKTVPLIKFESTLLRGLRFFTVPRFVIWLLWSTTSAAGMVNDDFIAKILIRVTGVEPYQHPRFDQNLQKLQPDLSNALFCKHNSPDWSCVDSIQLLHFAVRLCILIIFLSLETVVIKKLRPDITLTTFREEVRTKYCGNLVFFFYCFLLCFFLLFLQESSALYSFLLGLVSFFYMSCCFNREKGQNWIPTRRHCQVVDMGFVLLVEIVPLSSAIWGLCAWSGAPDGRGLFGALWRSYLWGGVLSATISTAIFQACNVYITISKPEREREATPSDEASNCLLPPFIRKILGVSRKISGDDPGKRFRVGMELEVQKRLESMFNRDNIPPGMLSHVPESIFKSTLKELKNDRDHSISLKAYLKEMIVQGVPAWKYLWYLTFASIFGYFLHVARLSQEGDGHAFNDHLPKIISLVVVAVILCGLRLLVSCVPTTLRGVLKDVKITQSVENCLTSHVGIWIPFWTVFLCWILVVVGSWMCTLNPQALEWLDLTESKQWIPGICPCFLVMAAFLSLALEKKAPGLVGDTYWKMVWLFALVFGLIMIIPTWELTPSGASTSIIGPFDTDYQDRDPRFEYEVCNWRHGPEAGHSPGPESLSVVDMAAFAGLTYELHDDKIVENFPKMFPNRTVNLAGSNKEHEYPRYVVFDIGTDRKTRVIAIKGTSDAKDIYMDITLFSIIKVLQGLEFVFPVIDLFPVDQIQWFLYRAHLFGQRDVEMRFWRKTKSALTPWANNGSNAILTGHSLGGLIAQVMAARLDLPALVFSSPGVKYSAQRFGIYRQRFWSFFESFFELGLGPNKSEIDTSRFGVQSLKAHVRNVIPDLDAVPRVDESIGVVDRIACRNGTAGNEKMINQRPDWSFGSCHMLKRTMCELWRSCGDVHKRKFDCSVSAVNSPKDINTWYVPDDYA